MGDDAATGPLTDVRVVELGQLLAGPFCGQLLADYGAEVIKVEDPRQGDPMRQWGREKAHGQSLWWPIVARNKKCITADIRTPQGQQIVRDLVSVSDVLLENFRPGTLERWGLDYQSLAELNPRLVLVRVSGYGQTGPYAPRPGYASIGEAMGGLRHVIGDPDRPASRAGISLGDTLAATFACLGTLAALHSRESSGRGQVVDASIYESVFACMESLVPEWVLGGYQRERTGAVLPNVSPSNVYTTQDGEQVLIAANMDSVFRRLAGAMGRPELGTDERFATHAARGQHSDELDGMIDAWSRTWAADALLDHLVVHAVPSGRIYKARDMLTDPQFLARQSIIAVEHPTLGTVPMQNIFPRLSETPGAVRWPGPALGEHNEQVLRGLLGYDEQRYAQLQAENTI